jgi:hypothetical protein
MRERRTSGSERGRGVNCDGKDRREYWLRGQPDQIPRDRRRVPRRSRQEKRTHTMTTTEEDPVLLTLTVERLANDSKRSPAGESQRPADRTGDDSEG